jgi:hypothetical protein
LSLGRDPGHPSRIERRRLQVLLRLWPSPLPRLDLAETLKCSARLRTCEKAKPEIAGPEPMRPSPERRAFSWIPPAWQPFSSRS